MIFVVKIFACRLAAIDVVRPIYPKFQLKKWGGVFLILGGPATYILFILFIQLRHSYSWVIASISASSLSSPAAVVALLCTVRCSYDLKPLSWRLRSNDCEQCNSTPWLAFSQKSCADSLLTLRRTSFKIATCLAIWVSKFSSLCTYSSFAIDWASISSRKVLRQEA